MFKQLKNAMTQELEMMDIRLMSYYLGIEVKQRDDGIFISQEGYAKEILKKFKMDDVNPVNTLVECGVKGVGLTLPIKAAEPPNLAIPTATLAGAPPGAFLKPGASASESPAAVGTKSISSSPKQTTSGLFFWAPAFSTLGDLGEPTGDQFEITNRSTKVTTYGYNTSNRIEHIAERGVKELPIYRKEHAAIGLINLIRSTFLGSKTKVDSHEI
ncbi:hypothetical protein RJ639_033161 [Escallonia herrerae]|uniref:Reverse transcriptase Ty1/copia-type domain-containing protein n=1 Tax=Escallonia herrerae TaxID=1293975 RepID=A0AA88X2B6_9ASTE|nr:hypothetical protein RJ639_033161 [Escallonia herrerae]